MSSAAKRLDAPRGRLPSWNAMEAKTKRVGRMVAVLLPQEAVAQLDLKAGGTVRLRSVEGGVVIERSEAPKDAFDAVLEKVLNRGTGLPEAEADRVAVEVVHALRTRKLRKKKGGARKRAAKPRR